MTPDDLLRLFETFDTNWAFDAYDRFIESLDPQVGALLKAKKQDGKAYVAVFGHTQVGKTTLILDLIDIDADKSVHVGKILRGGRAKGNSATPTAMEYCRAPDQNWRLKIGTDCKIYSSDAEMRQALAQLRTQMEERTLNGAEPCIVSIPSHYFVDGGGKGLDVRILDLPGDKPSDRTEQEHVKDMAKRYLLSADLILLVGKGDGLTFLKPEELTLPIIEDWQVIPGRFRVVTTFSFTAESVRARISKDKNEARVENVRKRLIEQIELSKVPLSNAAKKPGLYFPLEFGETWLKEKERHRAFYDLLLPTLEELKSELLSDICDAVTPIARLYGALDANITIGEVKKKRIRDIDDDIKEVDERIIENTRQNNVLESVKKEDERRRNELKDSLPNLSESKLKDDFNTWDAFRHSDFSASTKIEPKVKEFMEAALNAKDILKKQFWFTRPIRSKDTLSWFWKNVSVNSSAISKTIDDILEKSFQDFISHLNAYWTDWYFQDCESESYKKDRKQLQFSIESAQHALKNAAIEWWLEAAQAQRDMLENEEEDIEHNIIITDNSIKNLKKVMDSLEKKKKNLLSYKNDIEVQSNQDLQRCDNFINILNDAYHQELDKRYNAIFTYSDPTKSFIKLLSSVKMIRDGKRVWERIHSASCPNKIN